MCVLPEWPGEEHLLHQAILDKYNVSAENLDGIVTLVEGAAYDADGGWSSADGVWQYDRETCYIRCVWN